MAQQLKTRLTITKIEWGKKKTRRQENKAYSFLTMTTLCTLHTSFRLCLYQALKWKVTISLNVWLKCPDPGENRAWPELIQ